MHYHLRLNFLHTNRPTRRSNPQASVVYLRQTASLIIIFYTNMASNILGICLTIYSFTHHSIYYPDSWTKNKSYQVPTDRVPRVYGWRFFASSTTIIQALGGVLSQSWPKKVIFTLIIIDMAPSCLSYDGCILCEGCWGSCKAPRLIISYVTWILTWLTLAAFLQLRGKLKLPLILPYPRSCVYGQGHTVWKTTWALD